MNRWSIGCVTLAALACASTARLASETPKVTFDNRTPGQLSVAQDVPTRPYDAIWSDPPVKVTRNRLELREKIFFDEGKATIQPKSFHILDETAAVLKAHPEVKQVRIEGHTDDIGGKLMNAKLSQERAEAVRTYLVHKGIAADRLQAKGFGEERPVASNRTAQGRETNRRVEFTIQSGT